MESQDIAILTPALIENTTKEHDPKFLTRFTLIIFDECHHTHKKSAYNRLMTIYHTLKDEGEQLPQVRP